MEADEYDDAERTLDEVLKIDNQHWNSYFQLGKVLIAKDQSESAKKILERLLEQNPEYRKRDQVEELLTGL
jgi:tetratricopeptide (TPR) repeat protein